MIKELSRKTSMSQKQVKNWIFNKRRPRARLLLKSIQTRKKRRQIFKDYFVLNKYPNKFDLAKLNSITGIEEKMISQWFAKQRFLQKNKKSNSS